MTAHARGRLARASVSTIIGTVVHLAAGMLASLAAARLLGPTQFGELAILRTTVGTATLLIGSQVGLAATRATAALRTSDSARAGRVLGALFRIALIVSAAAAVVCLALAVPIARQLGTPHLTLLVALLAPSIFFNSLTAVETGALQGFEMFSATARLLAAEGVMTGILVAVGAYLDGTRGAVVAVAAAAIVTWIVRHRVLASAVRGHGITIVRPRRIIAELPLIRSLVVPTALVGFSAQPFAWLARALLARNSLADLGVFSVAYSWGAAVLIVPAQITRPAMPILTHLLAEGETSTFRRLQRDTLLVTLGVSLLVALPVIGLAPWIVRAYGKSFGYAAPVMCVIAASSILASLSSALRSALVASGEVWGQVVQSLLWGIVLIGMYLALPGRGAIELAFAYTAAFSVTLLVQGVLMIRALSGKRTRSVVDLSDPTIAEAAALLEHPEES